MRAAVSINATQLEELLGLVIGVADSTAPDGHELSTSDLWLVELARSAVAVGEMSAALWGGTAGASIASALGSLPVRELARWLVSYRKLVVKLAGGTVTVAEGVPAEVDLER